MDKVNVREIDAYSWECPGCEYGKLVCDGCGKEFEVGEVEN